MRIHGIVQPAFARFGVLAACSTSSNDGGEPGGDESTGGSSGGGSTSSSSGVSAGSSPGGASSSSGVVDGGSAGSDGASGSDPGATSVPCGATWCGPATDARNVPTGYPVPTTANRAECQTVPLGQGPGVRPGFCPGGGSGPAWYNSLGSQAAALKFHANDSDATHTNMAVEIAGLVTTAMKRQNIPLAKYLR